MTTTLTPSIQLRTAIPGPRSRELIARREAAVPNGLYKAHQIAIESANGALVTDVDGNVLIDFIGGIGTLNAGHCPPEVVAAIQAQASRLIHFSALVGTYEPYIELAERITTGRQAIIAFEGAYHGRTLMTLTLTSKYAFKKTFGPFAPEIYRAPFPDAYRMGLDEATAVERCWEAFERMLVAGVGPEAIAAVIIEPVQGEGGFIPVPQEFMRRLRTFCSNNGSLLIADEVQCGFGRTGTLFAMEQFGVEPDILVSAKSIAAGMPLSATTGRAEIMDRAHVGGIGGTYGGNPLACVAGIEVLKMFEDGKLLKRAQQIGQIVRERANGWKQSIPLIGDVRGLGPMIAIELVRDHEKRTPAPDEVLEVVSYCASRGLLLMRAGLHANCLRLLMPLVITDEQLQEGLDVLEEGLRAVSTK